MTKSQESKQNLCFYCSLSSGAIDIESLCGLCFFRRSFGSERIQDGTSQPEATITFAMFLRNGLSSSVYNVIASPCLPALPDRPVVKSMIMWMVSKTLSWRSMKFFLCIKTFNRFSGRGSFVRHLQTCHNMSWKECGYDWPKKELF